MAVSQPDSCQPDHHTREPTTALDGLALTGCGTPQWSPTPQIRLTPNSDVELRESNYALISSFSPLLTVVVASPDSKGPEPLTSVSSTSVGPPSNLVFVW